MSNTEWTCPVCTLLNHTNNICTLCGASKIQTSNINTDITTSQQSLLASLTPTKPKQSQPQNSTEKSEHALETNIINTNHNASNNTDINNDSKSDINMDEFENENDNEFESDPFEEDNNDGWGDADLCYDEQKTIQIVEEEDCQQMLQRALEKRRLAQSKLDSFWKCGKCSFLNHPSRAVCMMCAMPQLDVVHHIMMCPKNELKICVRCKAYVVPHLYDDHVLDCKPIGALDNERTNQAWFVKLTQCEQNAINNVNKLAIQKSNDSGQKLKLITLIKQIRNGKYVDTIDDTLRALYHFLEWEVPIIIRVHIADLIPKIINDTHYRNLFEIGTGSGGDDQHTRKTHERKMFGSVYDKAKAFERPKYGCLNIGLTEAGTQQANMYGDGYFLINNTTVRWRTTLTVMDSFSVNGECGTVKHCNHLLTQLQQNELEEIIEVALTQKKTASGGSKQNAYREIQIHGPVQLDRDVLSVHVPSLHKTNHKLVQTLNAFCQKNMCKLVYFDAVNVNNPNNNNINY